MKNLEKVEDMPLWKEANDIAEYMYGLLPDFPAEEEWHTRVKLHNNSVDFIFWAGLALGNVNPTGREFDWGNFYKYTVSLKTMYRFAGRQRFIKLDPAMMVRLDKLQEQITAQIEQSYAQNEDYRRTESEKDLKPWQERYEIWKKLGEEPR